MRAWKRAAVAAATLIGLGLTGGNAEAGQPLQPIGEVDITVNIAGPAASDIDSTWRPELYVGGSNEFLATCSTINGIDDPLAASRNYGCPVYEPTTFTLGFPTAPAPYQVDWSCTPGAVLNEAFTDETATFTVGGPTSSVSCDINMTTGMIFVDKIFPSEVDGPPLEGPEPLGGAARTDFTLEAYVTGGDLAAQGTDDSGAQCDGFATVVNGDCALLLVAPGDYDLGETGVVGYQATDASCMDVGSPVNVDGPPPQLGERLPLSAGTSFTISDQIPGASVYCSIVNEYFEGTVTLTKTITNDDGGTADFGDFTLELYRSGDGAPVATGACGNDGVCLQGDFPIGDYVVGEVGPDGYTRTVSQEIALPLEQLTESEASFTLDPGAQVTVNVASDDQPTTTTTLAPTTSDVGAGGITLPATGSSDRTGTLALLAIGLLALGAGATTLARRRP